MLGDKHLRKDKGMHKKNYECCCVDTKTHVHSSTRVDRTHSKRTSFEITSMIWETLDFQAHILNSPGQPWVQ